MNRSLVRQWFRQSLVAVLALFLADCASKPSLPKHASIERLERPAEKINFPMVVETADIIYFPSDRAVFGGSSEPAALLMEAIERSGYPFAVGWDLIDATQQPLLDQLPATADAAREQLISQLELVGSGRTREHCRAVLRNIRAPGVTHLALRLPALLIARMAAAEPLTSEEEKLLPRGYNIPASGLENYAARLRARGASDDALTKSYRLEVVRQQFVADKIVRQIKGAPSGARMVVFLAGSDLREDGVPFYVSQKARVRQLVLGPNSPAPERRMLTQR